MRLRPKEKAENILKQAIHKIEDWNLKYCLEKDIKEHKSSCSNVAWFRWKGVAELCIIEQLNFMNDLGWDIETNGNVIYFTEVLEELQNL